MPPTVQEPPLSFTNALVQLNTLVNDTDNFMFTADQKTQALIEAWHDSWVVTHAWDSSLSFVPGTFLYALPAAVTAVSDVYIKRASDQYPQPVANELWEIVNVSGTHNLLFNEAAISTLTDTYTLYLKGRYKLTVTDNLTNLPLINYVLSLAADMLMRKMSYMKVFRFLRNDTTMADILNLKRDLATDVTYWRSQLQRDYESA